MGNKGPTLGADIAKLMQRWEGRWIGVPIIIVLATVFAVALLVSLAGLRNVPSWMVSAPAVPALGIYYVLQLRLVWRTEIKGDVSKAKAGSGIATGKQVGGHSAIMPTIQGNNNTTYIVQASENLRATPRAAPAEPIEPAPAPKPLVELTEKAGATPVRAVKETLFDVIVVVAKASHKELRLELEEGDILEGSIISDATLNAYLMTERQYHKYIEESSFRGAKALLEDGRTATIRRTISKSGIHYVVFDTFNKQSHRQVTVVLKRTKALSART